MTYGSKQLLVYSNVFIRTKITIFRPKLCYKKSYSLTCDTTKLDEKR
jgi:hypothetical protein